MSDIRESAIELVARSLYEQLAPGFRYLRVPWDSPDRPGHELTQADYRGLATPAVSALESAGLLPSGVEEQGGEIYRSLKGHVIGSSPLERRYVTEWRPA